MVAVPQDARSYAKCVFVDFNHPVFPIDSGKVTDLGTATKPDHSATISGERSDITGSGRWNRFPMIIIEHQDGIFASKQHVTLRILHNRENLAHLSTIVVSGESSKNWGSKFSIGCKDDACITNKQKESMIACQKLTRQCSYFVKVTWCLRTHKP